MCTGIHFVNNLFIEYDFPPFQCIFHLLSQILHIPLFVQLFFVHIFQFTHWRAGAQTLLSSACISQQYTVMKVSFIGRSKPIGICHLHSSITSGNKVTIMSACRFPEWLRIGIKVQNRRNDHVSSACVLKPYYPHIQTLVHTILYIFDIDQRFCNTYTTTTSSKKPMEAYCRRADYIEGTTAFLLVSSWNSVQFCRCGLKNAIVFILYLFYNIYNNVSLNANGLSLKCNESGCV